MRPEEEYVPRMTLGVSYEEFVALVYVGMRRWLTDHSDRCRWPDRDRLFVSFVMASYSGRFVSEAYREGREVLTKQSSAETARQLPVVLSDPTGLPYMARLMAKMMFADRQQWIEETRRSVLMSALLNPEPGRVIKTDSVCPHQV